MSFRREAHVPLGGPDGGNGGDGGSVFVIADEGLNTLYNIRGQRLYRAENGKGGKGKAMHGRCGKDLYIKVPVGSMLWDNDKNELLADLTKHGQSAVVAQGGKGGRGNLSYASSQNRAPRHSQPGLPGEERNLRIELKLLADVGLVGRPNAGKSTLISRVSAAKAKVADYPFTTLQPQLGVVALGKYKNCTMADIPGLIEGAHHGAGMGIQFLKHIERTRMFLHLIDIKDPSQDDPWDSYQHINQELEAFSAEFTQRPYCIVITKIDSLTIPEDQELLHTTQELFAQHKIPCFAISSVTGEGLKELLIFIEQALQ